MKGSPPPSPSCMPRPRRQTRSGERIGGEACHMIGELLKKPPQQSGQGHALLMPQDKKRSECVCVGRSAQRETGGTYSSTCSAVLANLKTQAMILLAVLIFLLSGHFYSKSLTRLSLLHISLHCCRWIFTGGIQVNCLCSKAEG